MPTGPWFAHRENHRRAGGSPGGAPTTALLWTLEPGSKELLARHGQRRLLEGFELVRPQPATVGQACRFPLAEFLQADGPSLSYTQWEAWLALLHHKPLFIATPKEGTPRDAKYVLEASQQALQQAHLARLNSVERFAGSSFASQDDLTVQVLRSFVLDLLVQAGLSPIRPSPHNLPERITVKTNLPMPLRWHTKLVISLSLMQEMGNHNDIVARATTITTMEGQEFTLFVKMINLRKLPTESLGDTLPIETQLN